jgi:hypothetical protein
MNIYYNQPIPNAIAATFKVGPAAVAWVATATLLEYAAGSYSWYRSGMGSIVNG